MGMSNRITELQPSPLPRQKTPTSGWGRRLARRLGGVTFLVLVSVAVWLWLSHRPSSGGGAATRFSTRMTTTVGIAVAKKGAHSDFSERTWHGDSTWHCDGKNAG